LEALRKLGASRLVLAVGVAARDTAERLSSRADTDVVAVLEPEDLSSIGIWYQNFEQTPDVEVIELLHRAAARTEIAPVA